MTELEFRSKNPSSYGAGNINLLYSSSISTGSVFLPVGQYGAQAGISGSFYDKIEENSNGDVIYYKRNAFFPPYRIIGLTIPFASSNNVSLEATLRQIKSLKFTIATEKIEVKVLTISRLNSYFYLQTVPTIISNLPTENDSTGTPIDFNIEFTFINYLADNFENNDFNPLQGNALTLITSDAAYQVDRNTDSANPSNLSALITETAAPAEIHYSNYTTTGWTNARYKGTLNKATYERDTPAQSYISFEAGVHTLDVDDITILEIGKSDEIKKLYFNVESQPTSYIPTGSNVVPATTFPLVSGSVLATGSGSGGIVILDRYQGSVIYEDRGSDLIRVVSSKIHIVEEGQIYRTDEFGVAVRSSALVKPTGSLIINKNTGSLFSRALD